MAVAGWIRIRGVTSGDRLALAGHKQIDTEDTESTEPRRDVGLILPAGIGLLGPAGSRRPNG